jgi:hypothetical protein
LQVADLHTYAVGALQVLVHNKAMKNRLRRTAGTTYRPPEAKPLSRIGNAETQKLLEDALVDIRTRQRAPRQEHYYNIQQKLPVSPAEAGGQLPHYVEYDVDPSRPDFRIIHDEANGRWFFSPDFHSGGEGGELQGSKATWFEITDVNRLPS